MDSVEVEVVPDRILDSVADTAYVDDAPSRRSLNAIRFDNFTENDWLDNDYIRTLRKYIDDFMVGKVESEALEPYRNDMKGQFIIGWAEPYMLGGMFIQILFIDHPQYIFSAWIYSFVDEEAEEVIGYEYRGMSLTDTNSGQTREDILRIMNKRPEIKLW